MLGQVRHYWLFCVETVSVVGIVLGPVTIATILGIIVWKFTHRSEEPPRPDGHDSKQI